MTELLSVEGVKAGYGAITVLRDLSLRVGENESIGLFGPNGHGKTTLLRAISGLLAVAAGRITFAGADITNRRPAKIVGAGLIHSAQANTMFGDMAVAETLELAAFGRRARAECHRRMAEVLALFPRLAERKKQLARTLSGGERQMLSIGCALMCAPRLLMLDEPTLGLSPRLKEELAQAIGAIARTGVPLIVVEQDVEFLLALTDRLYMIEHGSVVREIAQSDGLDHAEVMQLYFGQEAQP
jgi:branched-chain amino acid transport system ATP-binding protein